MRRKNTSYAFFVLKGTMRAINWFGYKMLPYDGYGRFSIHMIRALVRQGVDVMPGLTSIFDDMPGDLLRLSGFDFSKPTIQCMPADMIRDVPGRVWGWTMTESTSCPDDWPDRINKKCERLLVPCEHNAEVFERKGVKCPIHVVYGGTDPNEFPVLARKRPERPFTFLCLGDRAPRKGHEQVWSAFYQVFADNPDVRLIIKVRPQFLHWMNTFNFPDRRIVIWRGDVDHIADVYAGVDCFVFPSYGEGHGMPAYEAAMMGLPVIATRWSGLAVDTDYWALPLERFTLGKAILDGHKGGQWAVCDAEEVAEKMLWVYEHQDEARAFGLRAAEWLRANRTWDHSAKQVVELLEKYA